jgi:hypothetical protein
MNLGDLIEKIGKSSEKEIKFDEPVRGGLIEFEFLDDGDHSQLKHAFTLDPLRLFEE